MSETIFGKYLQLSSRVAEITASVILLAMALLLSIQIVIRNMGMNIVWAQQLIQELHVWVIFLMLPVIEANSEHLRIEYFYQNMSTKTQDILSKVTISMEFIVLLVMLLSAISSAVIFSGRSSGVIFYPYNAQFYPVIIGSILYLLVLGHRAYLGSE